MSDLDFYLSWPGKGMAKIVDAVTNIQTESDAQRFCRGYAEHIAPLHRADLPEPISDEQAMLEATDIAKHNIEYAFGEGVPHERWLLWNRATGATHPYFGLTKPTPEEALEIGMKAVEEARRLAESK